MKYKFDANSTPTKKHFICQTRHGSWMIGVEVDSPINPSQKEICGGSCVEAPFSTLMWDTGETPKECTAYELKSINGVLTSVPMSKFMSSNWSDYFPTKKSLVEGLNQMGYTQGPRHGYHCWEIIKL